MAALGEFILSLLSSNTCVLLKLFRRRLTSLKTVKSASFSIFELAAKWVFCNKVAKTASEMREKRPPVLCECSWTPRFLACSSELTPLSLISHWTFITFQKSIVNLRRCERLDALWQASTRILEVQKNWFLKGQSCCEDNFSLKNSISILIWNERKR